MMGGFRLPAAEPPALITLNRKPVELVLSVVLAWRCLAPLGLDLLLGVGGARRAEFGVALRPARVCLTPAHFWVALRPARRAPRTRSSAER
jgi:hypothetical protein